MGAEVTGMRATLRFRVSAAGPFEQLPGCPPHVDHALSPERISSLCLDECYHPSDVRRRIVRIEVGRIRPAVGDGAQAGAPIEDPWLVIPCLSETSECRVEFEDHELAASGRTSAYYVRAIQEPTRAVNGGGLRCEFDE